MVSTVTPTAHKVLAAAVGAGLALVAGGVAGELDGWDDDGGGAGSDEAMPPWVAGVVPDESVTVAGWPVPVESDRTVTGGGDAFSPPPEGVPDGCGDVFTTGATRPGRDTDGDGEFVAAGTEACGGPAAAGGGAGGPPLCWPNSLAAHVAPTAMTSAIADGVALFTH